MRIENKYWIALLSWLFVFAIFFILNKQNGFLNLEDSNFILAGGSVGVSILSLGLARIRKPKFKGEVESWILQELDEGLTQIRFKISNNGKFPILRFHFSLKAPSNIVRIPERNKHAFSKIYFGDSELISTGHIPLLTNQINNYITIELLVDMEKLDQRKGKCNFYITLAGENIEPITYEFFKLNSEYFKKYNSQNPIQLKEKLTRKEKRRVIENQITLSDTFN